VRGGAHRVCARRPRLRSKGWRAMPVSMKGPGSLAIAALARWLASASSTLGTRLAGSDVDASDSRRRGRGFDENPGPSPEDRQPGTGSPQPPPRQERATYGAGWFPLSNSRRIGLSACALWRSPRVTDPLNRALRWSTGSRRFRLYVQPVKEVGSERALSDGDRQVTIGRRHHANVQEAEPRRPKLVWQPGRAPAAAASCMWVK